MTTACENEDSLEFTPFNDTDQPRIQQMILGNEVAEQGTDTRVIDPYRQGVSIRTPRHRFAGMQPKIGTDSACHYTKIVTYGQARDFTQYSNSSAFTDTDRLSTLSFLDNPEVFYPIILNDGHQQQEEAQIEPLSIPFKKNEYFEKYKAHGIHGNLEDGNQGPQLGSGNSKIQQFIEYEDSTATVPFLDEGSETLGDPGVSPNFVTYNPLAASITIPLDFGSKTYSDDESFILAYDSDGSLLNSNYYFTSSLPSVADESTLQGGPFTLSTTIEFGGNTYGSNTSSLVWNSFFRNDNWSVSFWFLHDGSTFYDLQFPMLFTENAGTEMFSLERFIIDSTGAPYVRVDLNSHAFDYNGVTVSGDVQTNFNVSLGGWNHFAVSYTPDQATSYVNGILFTSYSLTTALPDAFPDAADNITSIGPGSATAAIMHSVQFFDFSLTHDDAVTLSSLKNSPRSYVDYDYSNTIIVDGYGNFSERLVEPFNDTQDEEIVLQVQTTDTDMLSALRALDYDLSEDIRETFSKKSASAGTSVYGPGQARYGTDSIAYAGLLKGN